VFGKHRKLLVKILKVVSYFAASLLILLVSIILLIRLPVVQDKITQKFINFFEKKIGTQVELKRFFVSFPKKIVLEGLYLEDRSADTLVYLEKLSIDMDLWGLINNRVQLNAVELDNSRARAIKSINDSSFNFDYIINAFASNSSSSGATQSSWKFLIGDVIIKNTSLSYEDAPSGNNIQARIGKLIINADGLDPTSTNYKVSSIDWQNSAISVTITAGTISDSTHVINNTNNNIDFGFNKISLSKINLHFENTVERQKLVAKIGEFEVEANGISIKDYFIDLDEIKLINSSASFSQANADVKSNTASTAEPMALPALWNLKLGKITLLNNNLQYNDLKKPVIENSFDENHIRLSDFNLKAHDILVHRKGIEASINSVSVDSDDNFSIQSFSGSFKLTNTSAAIQNLDIKTRNSHLKLDAQAKFQSLTELQNNFEKTNIDLNVHQSALGLADIRYLSPALIDSIPIAFIRQEKVSVDSQIAGTLNNLQIQKLSLGILSNTSITLHGSVKGLPNIEQALFDATVDKLYTTANDIEKILPDSLTESFQLPDWISGTGNFSGTIKQPNIKVALSSAAGELKAAGTMNFDNLPSYNLQLSSSKLDLGKIFKQSDLGKINAKALIKGAGFTMDSLDVILDLQVSKFEFKNYAYHDFKMIGSMNQYLFSGSAEMKDENLDFEFKGDMNYQEDVPRYKFTFNLRNADFKNLHLSERPLRARATVDIDLASSDFKIMNGTLSIRNVGIYNGEALYKVDSLLFASIDQVGESEITIRSDILSGDFKGTINLFSLPSVFKQHINRYFSLQDQSLKQATDPQDFKFDLTFKKTELLTEIIFPELHSFVPGKIQGEFNGSKHKLAVAIEVARLKYASTAIDSFTVKINSDSAELRYKIRFKNALVDAIRVAALELSGKIAHDTIQTKLVVLDSASESKYALGGIIKSDSTNFQFHLDPKLVMLNYEDWTVPLDNYLQVGARGLTTHNFNLSKGPEKFSIITVPQDSSIDFQFKQWQLSNLTNLAEGLVPASGQLNGNFKITTSKKGVFNSTLTIKEFTILEKIWGDVFLSLNYVSNRYTLDLKVKGDQTNFIAKGFYVPNPSAFDFNIDLDKFDLRLIETLSFGQLKNVKGFINGSMHLSGNIDAPTLRGGLTFKDASFLSTYAHNSFSLKNERISFEDKGIVLPDFRLVDSDNNTATIKGAILTKAYKDFDFDLKVVSRNFQVLNTTIDDNTLYYGNVKVSATAGITGNINQPKLNIAAELSDGSEVTYVVPVAEKNALEQKGIVQFVSSKKNKDPFLVDLNLGDTIKSIFRGMDVEATLELTDKSILNIIIDPLTGDQLSLKGNSTLVLNSEASGSARLSGRYEITSGTYNFSFYKLLKREFEIVKGSSIIWSGDPLAAEMDIRASYSVETSPLDLVYNQINTTDQAEINSYNQRLPFLVYLNINGRLLVPQLSFSLDMPADKRNVMGGAIYAKLQDINTRESDLNKQVFALLILKRFISDNPFESQAGTSASNTARVSVSRLLSEQLNQLSKNIKGVQLNFDIKSYENNTGTEILGETRAQLGISKNLFNDRLVVKLSGNVDIEGQNTNQNSVTDYIGDLALEYRLTSDGRLRITGFRTSNYDMIDGELTETGVGLIYIKDYNTLQQLFKSNAK